ncbi:MAG TPA: amino acid adenylation domain-containing protein, partial [Blastocatellia bacterium]|nr:amino acid adenylation domain-containing protein [Blastocatellia bacterium]
MSISEITATWPAQTIDQTQSELIPLSTAQQGVWFDQICYSDLPVYNIGLSFLMDGPFDIALLRKAINLVVKHHDAMRLVMRSQDGIPAQRLIPELDVSLTIVNFSGLPEAEAAALAHIKREFETPFQFEGGPLFSFQIVCVSASRSYWLQRYHHLITDGFGIDIIHNAIAAAYNQLLSGAMVIEPAVPSYRQFIAEDLDYLESERFRRDQRFWQERFAVLPPPLIPQSSTPGSRSAPMSSEEAAWTIDRRLFNQATEYAKAAGCSTPHFLLALLSCYFARVTGETDIVIGVAIHNRHSAIQKKTVGMFSSILPLRIPVDPEQCFSDLLKTISYELRRCYKHQRLPLPEINRCANLSSSGRKRLYDISFSFDNFGFDCYFGDLQPKVRRVYAGFSQTPLAISVNDYNDQDDVPVVFEFNTGYLNLHEANQIQARLAALMNSVLNESEVPIKQLPLLSPSEHQQVLFEWNATDAAYPHDKCVHELFEAQVEKNPTAIALVHDQQRLTYAELNARANRLAWRLHDLGLRPGAKVAIRLDRSAYLVIAQLAILKCGAAYVPVDPTFPDERQAFMILDCAAPFVITTRQATLPETIAAQRVEIDDFGEAKTPAYNLNLSLDGETTAYVMYTSGSTGRPKGVMVPHRAIGRLVLNCGYADFNAGDRVAFAANPAFDAATMEVWAPLLNGGRIVIIDRESFLDPKGFAQLLDRHQVTTLFLTTAVFNQYSLAIPEALARLRFLLCGGERSDPASFARVLASNGPQHLIHCYGPTEATTFAITYEVMDVPPGAEDIPLGRPISNTQIYILDQRRQPSPIGVTGEIYIGGAGVAQGYLNRPELTEERFLPDPFSREPEARMYKTGDLGRWLRDGNIEFLGRNDFQVKIRGFRIELGEIETALSRHPEVREAVVTAPEDGEGGKRLVAYYTGAELGAEVLRGHLSAGLPDYMVPTAYVHLDALPLTPNGKLDRRALPAPDSEAYVTRGYEPPLGETETLLARNWADLLKLERVSRQDNFFELGGHSLLAVTLIERMRRNGLHADVREMFTSPTLAALAAAIRDQTSVIEAPPNG